MSGWVSAAVYLLLAIGDTLSHRGRVLYLDVDTLVLIDLRPLLLTSLEGAAIGAVRDPQNPVIGAGIALPGWTELGLPRGRDYFNSGVMLLDLPACERQEVFSPSRGFLADHPKQARLWDQDALNVAVGSTQERLVVWLDEVDTYFDGDQVTGGTIRALLGAADPVVLIGTIRADRHAAHALPPTAMEETDAQRRHRELHLIEDTVRLDTRFSHAETARAHTAAAGDSRLAACLRLDATCSVP